MNRIRCFPTIEQHQVLRLVSQTGLRARIENGHVVLTNDDATICAEITERKRTAKLLRFQYPTPPDVA